MLTADAAAQRLTKCLSGGRGLRPSIDSACAGDVCAALLFRLMHSTAVLATPIIVFFLLEWFVDDSQPEWPGYCFAAGFGVVGLIAACAQSCSLRCSLRAGVSTRTALCALAMQRSHQLEWASVVDRSESESGLVSSASAASNPVEQDGDGGTASDRTVILTLASPVVLALALTLTLTLSLAPTLILILTLTLTLTPTRPAGRLRPRAHAHLLP